MVTRWQVCESYRLAVLRRLTSMADCSLLLSLLSIQQVARQLATVAGLGRRRPKPKKEEKPKMGQEGEDIIADETGEALAAAPSCP